MMLQAYEAPAWFGVKLLHHPMPGPGKTSDAFNAPGECHPLLSRPVTQVWTCSRYTRSFAHVQIIPFNPFGAAVQQCVARTLSYKECFGFSEWMVPSRHRIAHSSPKASPPGPILTGRSFGFLPMTHLMMWDSSDPAYPSMASQSSSWAQQVEERPRQPVTHIFESFPPKSKSKRRRARHLSVFGNPSHNLGHISCCSGRSFRGL